jgi:hypothetical protein
MRSAAMLECKPSGLPRRQPPTVVARSPSPSARATKQSLRPPCAGCPPSLPQSFVPARVPKRFSECNLQVFRRGEKGVKLKLYTSGKIKQGEKTSRLLHQLFTPQQTRTYTPSFFPTGFFLSAVSLTVPASDFFSPAVLLVPLSSFCLFLYDSLR